MNGVFDCVTRWCVHGAVHIWYGTVGVDKVWLGVVGVGAMFSALLMLFLKVVVMIIYGVLGMFGFLF